VGLAAGSAVLLAVVTVATVAALPGSAGEQVAAGSGPVTTVRTTVYVDPSQAAGVGLGGTAGAVTAPPLTGETDAATSVVASPATGSPASGPPTNDPTTRATEPTGTTGTTGSGTAGPPTTSTPRTRSTADPTAPTTSTLPSFVDTITAAPAASASRTRSAVTAAVQAAAAKGITQSVVVLDRKTGKTIVSVDDDREVPAVSIAKLLFATDELVQAGGGAHLDADDAADLFDMIRRSNDDLADVYYGYHGESAIVQRVADEYHLTGTEPAPDPRYWGGITVTAEDIASLLRQTLADPAIGPYLAAPMKAASHTAADGYDQEFGMNAVARAGSKQGWGCCLGGVVAIHSAGFTTDRIVVVLSTALPDAAGINKPEVSSYQNDPGFKASVAAVTATAAAAVDP
jgi:hypothetical protein